MPSAISLLRRFWSVVVGTIGFFRPTSLRIKYIRAAAWLRNAVRMRRYNTLSRQVVEDSRKSEILFIFGSGFSLNNLTPAEISHFEQHNTLGFNYFFYQNSIRVDYHIIRELCHTDLDRNIWEPYIEHYVSVLNRNEKYRDTILLMQEGFKATSSNRMIGLGYLPFGKKIFRWHNGERGKNKPPAKSFQQGLTHGAGTLTDAVNFGALVGWRKIVLVGVDLYDRRYFWLKYDELRATYFLQGKTAHTPKHNTADPVIEQLGRWNDVLKAQGVELFVYNPRSLLVGTLPLYELPEDVRKEKKGQSPVAITGPWHEEFRSVEAEIIQRQKTG